MNPILNQLADNYLTKIIPMDERELRELTEEVIQIYLKKNADYGSASFDLGLVAIWYIYGIKLRI